MFERTILIDGRKFSFHEVTEIKHAKDRQTVVRVKSYVSNPLYGGSESVAQAVPLPVTDGLTFATAEETVMDDPRFDEYVDPELAILQELAPTLTDEQASTVSSIYPVWDPAESYASGDRVRYSDGFYKCIQAHDAQESWYPAAAASLWSPIIDATALPIGEYPLWRQPESTNPYSSGDVVTWNGTVWESVIDNNVWAPGVYGWEPQVQEEPEPEPQEPSVPEEPENLQGDEPEPGSGVQEWVQPDSTNPYMNGDHVMHNGVEYASTIDNNVWEPGVYGWETV